MYSLEFLLHAYEAYRVILGFIFGMVWRFRASGSGVDYINDVTVYVVLG